MRYGVVRRHTACFVPPLNFTDQKLSDTRNYQTARHLGSVPEANESMLPLIFYSFAAPGNQTNFEPVFHHEQAPPC